MSPIDAFFTTVKLPSISEVAQQLINSLNDEDAGVAEVSAIIAKDPALSAKLLRLANSAQFGLPRGVSSVQDAIQMVGMGKVRTLALGSCLSESFPVLPGLDAKEFWRTSMASRKSSTHIAQGWLSGMMLRLGELLIGQANPLALAEIEKLPHLPGGRWEREKRLVGFSEGEITAELTRRWNFPVAIIEGLDQAFDPLAQPVFSKLAGVVHLAGTLADIPDAKAEAVDGLPAELITKLGLEATWMRAKFPAADSFVNVS